MYKDGRPGTEIVFGNLHNVAFVDCHFWVRVDLRLGKPDLQGNRNHVILFLFVHRHAMWPI